MSEKARSFHVRVEYYGEERKTKLERLAYLLSVDNALRVNYGTLDIY
jgi:hypothetical protein